jgi:hypothetical protein
MLKKNRPLTIPATLTVKSQGELITFDLVYKNLKQSEWMDFLAAQRDTAQAVLAPAEGEPAPALSIADTILKCVESWDSEYPLTREGIEEMHDDRPGLVYAITEGFYEARQAQRVKN